MIKSLQGLRSIGMLCIFLFHAGFIPNGIFPVTFFFILSGFVLYYSLNHKVDKSNFFQSLMFGLKRGEKLYFIHFITFCLSILIKYSSIDSLNMSELFISSFRNLTFTQTLTPTYSLSYNNLSWYLATLFVCYLFAHYFVSVIKKVKFKTISLIIFILIIQLLLVLFIPLVIEDALWFLYMSPYYRILDFLIGMLTAKLYLEKKQNVYSTPKYILGELSFIFLLIISYLLSFKLPLNFTRGIIYTPIFIVGIYFISFERGILKKFLLNRYLIRLVKYSFEFYMFHELILIVFRRVFSNMESRYLLKIILISIPSFFISLMLAIFINHINSKIINHSGKIKLWMLLSKKSLN